MLQAIFGSGSGQGMSDTSQGPGWWLASDGKWYPPELWTGPPGSGPAQPVQDAPTYGAAPYGQAIVPPGSYPPGVYGGYPGVASGQYPQYGTVTGRRTNGLAVASLVCAIAGFLFFIPAILGIIFGFVARSQIRQSGGTQGGDGLAVAGIIVGFAWVLLFVIVFIVSAATTNTNGVVLAHLATAV
jgi:uncharacterized protein DUF4190